MVHVQLMLGLLNLNCELNVHPEHSQYTLAAISYKGRIVG